MEASQEKVEKAAVRAVGALVDKCDRLEDRFSSGDKLPLTDGAVDLYDDFRRKGGPQYRVSVQIKGTTTKLKTGNSGDVKRQIPREVIEFLGREGGGIFFVGAMPKSREPVTVYYLIITPYKAQDLLDAMKEEQKSVSARLTRVDEPADLVKAVEFVIRARAQGHAPRLDLNTHDMSVLRLIPLKPLSSTRPETLKLLERDFIAEIEILAGYWVPLNVDLTIYPASYRPQEVPIDVSCGKVSYRSAIAQQTGEGSGVLRLSTALAVKQKWDDSAGSQSLSFDSAGSVGDVFKAVTFFMAASEGHPVVINGRSAAVRSNSDAEKDVVVTLHKNLSLVAESLLALSVNPSDVDYASLTDKGLADLAHLRDALVAGREIKAAIEGYGRFDLAVGAARVILIVAPGHDDAHKRFFDPFDPASAGKFQVKRVSETGEVTDIPATAYDGLNPDDFAAVLNLRLPQMADAYARLDDEVAGANFAHRTVLNMISAADQVSGARRDELLASALEVNAWVAGKSPSPVHDVNRLQILHRQRPLNSDERQSAMVLRDEATSTAGQNTKAILACVAILLGDSDEITRAVDALEPGEREDLETRPIWNLQSAPARLHDPR